MPLHDSCAVFDGTGVGLCLYHCAQGKKVAVELYAVFAGS
jgi:hypothetical protein